MIRKPTAGATSSTLQRLRPLMLCAAIAVGMPVGQAMAQTSQDTQAIRQELQSLREEQSRIAQLQQRTEAAIAALEARIGVAPAAANEPVPSTAASTVLASPPPSASSARDRLKITGDFRLRGQHDRSDDDGQDRSSSQVRARLGATFAINDRVTVGGRIATGDADDPNSSDTQLSNWNDDFSISLDLAYAQLAFGDLKIYGGKFPQPFTRTDLVWDGDVNPQGIGATYKRALAGGGAFRTNALFFVVDEQAAGADSTMGGVQLGYDSPAYGGFKYDISGAYYRYSLGSVAGADSGDWRTNRRNPDGTFLSNYELANLLMGVTLQGADEKWPVRLVGDYVRNLGAIDD